MIKVLYKTKYQLNNDQSNIKISMKICLTIEKYL